MRDRVKSLEEENKALISKTKLANQFEEKIKVIKIDSGQVIKVEFLYSLNF